MNRAGFRAVAVALALMVWAPFADAQGTARSMDIDASVISAGMAGASTAVFWGGEPNVWANPALLGYYQGIRWQWGETQLVPGLADDVRFSVTRLTLAGAGIGFENAGDPADAGGIELEYGLSEGTDQSGSPTGTFGSYERVDAMGAGVSVGRLIEAIAAMQGSEPPGIVRHLDVAVGWRRKDTVVQLSPSPAVGRAEAASRDFGLLVRAGGTARGMPLGTGPELRVDLAYGYSVINYDGAAFVSSMRTRRARPRARIATASRRGSRPVTARGAWALTCRSATSRLSASTTRTTRSRSWTRISSAAPTRCGSTRSRRCGR